MQNIMVVGGVMLPLVDIDVTGVVGQTVWGVDVHPDCAPLIPKKGGKPNFRTISNIFLSLTDSFQ